ncbi:protein anachronism isoform X2 [Drosophila santomea]|uniref:protein anachronism isoform X2 n=1 Tax=Drosophila santomea TaxID=129105 RepID=UPI001954C212|nr:protein anachronism isoform X2 [Drosophila santomea]
MANAMRGKRCGRSRIRELILILSLITMAGDSRATPFDPSFFIEGVQSEVVNPFNRTILNRFNLTEEQILSIQNRSNPNMRDDSGQSSNQQYLQQVATQRLNDIFKRVQKAISNEPNGSVSKEKAGFPICNAETTSSEDWSQGNNVTLQFASSVFISNNDDRLSSALLRLYKTNPGQTREQNPGQVSAQPISTENPGSTAPNCAEQPPVGPQIRVTVSIVHQQRKKQRKKRTCNTAMLSSSSTGWVEIDVKCALAYWEQQHRQQLRQQQPLQPQLTASVVGILMIEVHDDEENLLRPGLYFAPPTCDQADIAVPWSVYRTEPFKSHLASWTLPRKPRLDISFNGSNSMKSTYNTPKSRAFIESTTSNSPTIDNQLDESGEHESQHQQIQRVNLVHHRRHHHNHQQPESDSESAQLEAEIEATELMSSASNSEQQMEPISNHHRHRTGQHHPHQLHQHQHHHHRHTKHHRIPAHKLE